MTYTKMNDGLIICTDTTCTVSKHSWPDIPTLLWPEGIDEDASDWLRELVVDSGILASSAMEYAKTLRPFLRFCRGKRDWRTVDDDFLIIWREYLLRTLKLSIDRINRSLDTVFSFYRWAEETKRLRFRVGVYTIDQLPVAMQQIPFPITAKQKFSKGQHGRVFGTWTTPLRLSGSEQNSVVRHTPTETEIRKLHEVAVNQLYGERNSLILSWAEEVGARRAEILRVCKSQMPDAESLADLIEMDEPWIIYVERKGGKKKPLNVQPDLILRTMDFIEYERAQIVTHCRQSIQKYKEPDEIFLSSKTGTVLHRDSVTSIGLRTFSKAGVKNANVHRLRARFAVRTIESLVDALFSGEVVGPQSSWVETILIKAAEQMGHSSPRSLRPYLNYVLNRRLQTSPSIKAEKLASRVRQLHLQERTLVHRLAQYRELEVAVAHLTIGQGNDAATALRKLADELCSGSTQS
ncbi:MAG: hypothetical protein CFE43_01955 [Burkholderiales bacterium PBB3]|nr:MAG: hypothetical protein CFE43_01955 [Burkholderiales bacterium PBB3]